MLAVFVQSLLMPAADCDHVHAADFHNGAAGGVHRGLYLLLAGIRITLLIQATLEVICDVCSHAGLCSGSQSQDTA